MKTDIVPGSLAALASQQNASIAETFINADVVILVDVSSSMDTVDAGPDGRDRYTRACSELKRLQQTLPGKIAVVAFSSEPLFCPGGQPAFLGGGTQLDKALKFVRVADDCDMRFIVISDGEPWEPDKALREARRFTSRIDTVFVGEEGGPGQHFLHQLATASGGQSDVRAAADGLAIGIQKLLTAS